MEAYIHTYVGCCTINVRSGLVWFKAHTWKLRGTKKESKKGRRPLYGREEDSCILYKMSLDGEVVGTIYLRGKWLVVNEVASYKTMINCTNAV
jgi:hypothetical protein